MPDNTPETVRDEIFAAFDKWDGSLLVKEVDKILSAFEAKAGIEALAAILDTRWASDIPITRRIEAVIAQLEKGEPHA